MKARNARRWFPLGTVGFLLLGACAPNAPMDTLNPASDIARRIDGLWELVFWIAVVVFVLVEGAILVAVVRFRARRREDPEQVHGNTRLEIAWTIVPALLLAALAVPTVSTIFALADQPEDAMRVTVTAHQWWWEYEYPDSGLVTANELHIPTGQTVLLTLRSNDIIHSFWAPRLAGKQDVVPGKDNHLQIAADEPGWYEGQCAEYCGLSHSNMRLRVRAHAPEDFEAWVESQTAPPEEPTSELAQRGKTLFEEGQCAGCHTIEGVSQGELGPNLTHFADRDTFAGAIFKLNEENLRTWLRDPPEAKPGALMPDLGLDDEEIDALVAYLQVLR